METQNIFNEIMGKTIAVVYAFEGENAVGFKHYHIWKSDVISEWLKAIQDLKGLPFILDVRTFTEKAMNNTLPHIDYVINLNCGSCELSPMGLVPSVCGFLSIPCIPCNTVAIVSGENKNMSNLIANSIGINVPEYLLSNDENGIYRPLNYGSSVGVRKGFKPTEVDGVYQKFIPGYDITTPMVYNPYKKSMDILPTVIFIPEKGGTEWFYGEKENISNTGYTRKIIKRLSLNVEQKYRELAEALSIKTFCRIDARLQSIDLLDESIFENLELNMQDIYFTEINPMPSIRLKNNEFFLSFSSINKNAEINKVISSLNEIVGEVTLHNYLLACSMLSY